MEDPRHFSVRVAGAELPLFGECRKEGGILVFTPRFPLREGLEYIARIDPPGIEKKFLIPAPPPGTPTRVRQVRPSRDTLPENLLKFYIHFSAPMSRGESYRRIHLQESGGRKVDLPFLELGEELWDRSGTRLTLFFDPGRIKRGLKPREEAGPALEEGKSYVLRIDRDWPDAAGHPLQEEFRKAIKVVAPDEFQPDPRRWKCESPRAGTKDPLTLTFNEPLDDGMLGRVLVVLDGGERAVAGRIEVDQEETRWRFHPEGAWKAGTYSVAIDTALEDLAGNSIARPFEVDAVRPLDKRLGSGTTSLPFRVE